MELIWLGKVLWMLVAYVFGLVAGVLAHELGHALAALLATRQSVLLQVGRGPRALPLQLGRLSLRLSWQDWRYGFTRYDRAAEAAWRQSLVALCGPLASLALAAFYLVALDASSRGGWAWWGFAGAFVANLRILLVSLWPLPYRPDGDGGEVWLSDALDLWRLWRGH